MVLVGLVCKLVVGLEGSRPETNRPTAPSLSGRLVETYSTTNYH